MNNRHGEFWLEVKNGVLFSVTQYEGYKDRHYICFHTSNICLYHQGKTGDIKPGHTFEVELHRSPLQMSKYAIVHGDATVCMLHVVGLYPGMVEGDTPVSDIKLPCRTRPHWLEPAIYLSEAAPDRPSPSEGIGLDDHSMLSVAVKISSQNMERNVKVGTPHFTFLLVCINLCQCLKH